MSFRTFFLALLLAFCAVPLSAQALAMASGPIEDQPALSAPATAEAVSLDMTFHTESLVTLEVRDALGQVLFSSQVIYPAGERQVKVSLGEVEEGVYFVRAATDEQEKTEMMVVNRNH